MPSPDRITPTMRRILDLLSDGRPHTKQEIAGCLYSDKVVPSTVRTFIADIRKVLRPKGHDILCKFEGGKIFYQHVRLLRSNDE